MSYLNNILSGAVEDVQNSGQVSQAEPCLIFQTLSQNHRSWNQPNLACDENQTINLKENRFLLIKMKRKSITMDAAHRCNQGQGERVEGGVWE